MKGQQNPFLEAEWRKLIMANYVVDPRILFPFVPPKTEIDTWQNDCYVSLVGFLFKKVRIKGMMIPFHTRFPEVNLRFYVRYKEGANWKRGVVFISEIVPKPAVALVANTLYKENYSVARMKNSVTSNLPRIDVSYEWKRGEWNSMTAKGDFFPKPLVAGSKEEFITEHFWGYASKNPGETVEYHVEHPRWDIYTINEYKIECDFGREYGPQFGFLSHQKPDSVFMAEGSPVKIYPKKVLKREVVSI